MSQIMRAEITWHVVLNLQQFDATSSQCNDWFVHYSLDTRPEANSKIAVAMVKLTCEI